MINEFIAQMSRQGLARSSRWTCTVFPPASLGGAAKSLSQAAGNNKGETAFTGASIDTTGNAKGTNEARKQASGEMVAVTGGSASNKTSPQPVLGYEMSNINTSVRALSLNCLSASIPARDILNSEFTEYGETRNLAIKHTHSDLAVTYYLSEDLRERYFFEQWQDSIFNPENKRHGYYKDYIGTMEIDKYNASWNEKTTSYAFYEVYPTNIGESTLTYESTEVLTCTITFKYRYYKRIA